MELGNRSITDMTIHEMIFVEMYAMSRSHNSAAYNEDTSLKQAEADTQAILMYLDAKRKKS